MLLVDSYTSLKLYKETNIKTTDICEQKVEKSSGSDFLFSLKNMTM